MFSKIGRPTGVGRAKLQHFSAIRFQTVRNFRALHFFFFLISFRTHVAFVVGKFKRGRRQKSFENTKQSERECLRRIRQIELHGIRAQLRNGRGCTAARASARDVLNYAFSGATASDIQTISMAYVQTLRVGRIARARDGLGM